MKKLATFEAFFRAGPGGHAPRPYQTRLAVQRWPETCVIPTGFGKTAAVLSAWLWKVANGDPETPRRLVYCLPMRTLVEQTVAVADGWIKVAREVLGLEVESDVLMGGRGNERRGLPSWILRPERPAVLIGTQDIFVSAGLMRSYGASRYRWPVDFAFLHNGAFWVFDEVQLAGSALATSAQLEAFRREFGLGRTSRTLWMSATLDPQWLRTADFQPIDKYRPHDLNDEDLVDAAELWAAKKSLERLNIEPAAFDEKGALEKYAMTVAAKAIEQARPGKCTIVFLNTVARAQAVFEPGPRR